MSHSTLNPRTAQQTTRREILHKGDLIPPLPELVVRLLDLLGKQSTEPAHLENVLQNDQVLVARMLAMVNSPFYGLHRQIRTIREAVMVIGFRGVRSLVLATSTARFLQRDFRCYGLQPRGLWMHAVCVAAASRRLARACKMTPDDAEALFVAGLLHDIGKLLLVGYLDETVPAGPICEHERARVGIDHAEAGALVTAKWNLAPEIHDVIRSHHGDADEGHPRWVAVVRLADHVAHERGTGYQPGRSPTASVLPGDLATLGLSPESWSALHDELAATMDAALAALGDLSS